MLTSLRLAVRRLRRAPGYALAIIGILALGFGATAAVLGVADAALLRPFPYRDPAALVEVRETFNHGEGSGGASFPNFRDWQAGAPAFAGLAAYQVSPVTLAPASAGRTASTGTADRVRAAIATPNLFRVLGVGARVGRALRPGDGGPASTPVVVLGNALWRTRFGGDPAVVGRTIRVEDSLYTVVGVMPAGFRFPAEGGADLWIPYDPTPAQEASRGSHGLEVIGRLRPGVTQEGAHAQLVAVAARLARVYPDDQSGRSVDVRALRDAVAGYTRPTLLALTGAALLVLLIAIANVANLALARAAAGRREMAVRLALGASRWQLARDGLAEAVLLAGVAGVTGALAAQAGFAVLGRAAGDALPLAAGLRLDAPVVVALIGAGALAAMALAVIPLFGALGIQGASGTPRAVFAAGGPRAGISTGERRTQGGLVIAQIALSLALLAGAGVLLRTVSALRGTPLGLDPERVLTAHVPVPNTRPGSAGPTAAFLRPVLERLRATPGITAAGAISLLPLQEMWHNGLFTVEGAAPPAGEPPIAEHRIVSPGYFGAMHVPLLAGRDVAERVPLPVTPDSAGAANTPCEIVVNAALARGFLTGTAGRGALVHAIGRRLLGVAASPCTVVGVVGDVRQWSLARKPLLEIYYPYGMFDGHLQGADDMVLVVRSPLPATLVTRAVREVVRAVDPGQPVYKIETMTDVVNASLADRQLYAGVLGAFGATALTLAAAGVYAVLAYAVARRRREMGVRMALGARGADIVRLVVREGAVLAGMGVVAGIAGAALLTRALRGVLYGVTAADPVSFALAAAALTGVALLAAWLPARRAARVDPAVALRAE